MRFLLVSKSRQPFSPEMAEGLVDAMEAWVKKYTQGGKFEKIWTFAEGNGGGALVNVDSHEELNEIMSQYPFALFTDNEVHSIVDLPEVGLSNLRKAIQAMSPKGS